MIITNKPSAEHIHLALDRTLSLFNDSVKQTLLFYIKQKDPSFDVSPSIDKIENALRDLLGLGGEIIIQYLQENLQQIRRDK